MTVVIASLLLAGCQNLQFTQDHRLTFTSPKSEGLVHIPFTISWSMKDFDLTGPNGASNPKAGSFGIFIDQPPMPVGKNLSWLVRNDVQCKGTTRCLSAQSLAEKYIFVTTKDSLTLNSLMIPPGVGNEQHYVTIVLLDGKGTRELETSWYLNFQLHRRSSE